MIYQDSSLPSAMIALIVILCVGFIGSFEKTNITFSCSPDLPVGSKETFIVLDSPGFKFDFSGFEAVQPQVALVCRMFKFSFPVFVITKLFVMDSS